MGTYFPEPEGTALLTLIEDAFIEAFLSDPDLAAAVADTVTVDPSVDAVVTGVALPPWIVVVTHQDTRVIVAANFYTDARAAVEACRDVEAETGGTCRGMFMPATPLTFGEIEGQYPDDGEAL